MTDHLGGILLGFAANMAKAPSSELLVGGFVKGHLLYGRRIALRMQIAIDSSFVNGLRVPTKRFDPIESPA